MPATLCAAFSPKISAPSLNRAASGPKRRIQPRRARTRCSSSAQVAARSAPADRSGTGPRPGPASPLRLATPGRCSTGFKPPPPFRQPLHPLCVLSKLLETTTEQNPSLWLSRSTRTKRHQQVIPLSPPAPAAPPPAADDRRPQKRISGSAALLSIKRVGSPATTSGSLTMQRGRCAASLAAGTCSGSSATERKKSPGGNANRCLADRRWYCASASIRCRAQPQSSSRCSSMRKMRPAAGTFSQRRHEVERRGQRLDAEKIPRPTRSAQQLPRPRRGMNRQIARLGAARSRWPGVRIVSRAGCR